MKVLRKLGEKQRPGITGKVRAGPPGWLSLCRDIGTINIYVLYYSVVISSVSGRIPPISVSGPSFRLMLSM